MPSELSPAVARAWAKSSIDASGTQTWCPLWLHLLDTAATIERLATTWALPSLEASARDQLTTSPDPITDLVALARWIGVLHDIGKLTPAFASKVPALDDRMREAGLTHEHLDEIDRRRLPHGLAGQNSLIAVLEGIGWSSEQQLDSAYSLASVVGAHHGIPPQEIGSALLAARPDLYGDYSWQAAREELFTFVTERTASPEQLARWSTVTWKQPFLVLLSGLVITADWLASNTDYFPLLAQDDLGIPLLDPVAHSRRAARAWDRIEVPLPWLPQDTGASAHALLTRRFSLPAGAQPRPLQEQALHAARSMDVPGLLILEDSTGSGKTEAALLAAESLAARSGRSGILFALPTQATTDAMFTRQLAWLTHIASDYDSGHSPDYYNVQLVHGRSRLNQQARRLRHEGRLVHDSLLGTLASPTEDSSVRTPSCVYGEPDGELTPPAFIAPWFSGRKRTMLADFVTTTVDHVLLAALRSPHLALRHLGLARKVVIIDEVHSYSTYMNVYLDRALTWLASYRVPVILLSATLSNQRTRELISAYRRGLGDTAGTASINAPFPCVITAGHEDVTVAPCEAGRSAVVRFDRLSHDDALLPLLTTKLADGGCALIIRNTVKRAQQTYEELRAVFGDDVTLNHARFTIADRQAKDDDLLRRFGPPRDATGRPHRAVVVATQVAEQSLDIDFDLLVTDLAPIDLLLQRAGRLHRHERPRPSSLRQPECYVAWLPHPDHEPRLEPGAAAIYGERNLLLSAAALNRAIADGGYLRTPQEVRSVMESVYGAPPAGPVAWAEALRLAERKATTTEREKTQSAKPFLLKEPRRTRATLVDWLRETMTPQDEDRAAVRDGEDSVEVILLQRQMRDGVEQLLTLPTATPCPDTVIPTSHLPVPGVIDTMARSAVRLPRRFAGRLLDQTLAELEAGCHVSSWQDSPLLRGQLFLPLNHGQATVAGITLSYDPMTGLKEVPTP